MKKNILKSCFYSVVVLLFSNCSDNQNEISDNQNEFENKLTKARECLNSPLQYQKDLDGAILFYTHAVNIDSSKAIAFYERSLVYDQKGEREMTNFMDSRKNGGDSIAKPYFLKSISDINKAIYLDPTNPTYYRTRAYFYRSSHHYNLNNSISDHNKVLQLNPNDYEALCSRGRMKFYDLKDSSSAFLDFKEAIKINPKNYRAHQDWADCLYECGSYYEAIEKYRLWVKLEPLDEDGNPHALYFLTRAQLELGDYYAVIANCERIREYKPDWAEVYLHSAEAKIKLGLIEVGKKELLQYRKAGFTSDLYLEYFGTKEEKIAEEKRREDRDNKNPNLMKKWPLKEYGASKTFYE